MKKVHAKPKVTEQVLKFFLYKDKIKFAYNWG